MRKETVEEPLAIPLTVVDVGEVTPGPAPSRKYREQQMRPHVQYVGCRITDDGREYTLRAPSKSPHSFVLFIAHGHFASGQARFQDGPDLCCAKLTRVLAEEAVEAAPEDRLVFTAEELLEYRNSRTAPERKRPRRRPDAD